MTVVYSHRAQVALLAIWDWNEEQHGALHATRYVESLRTQIERLAQEASPGQRVAEGSDLRYAPLRRTEKGHYHLAVFTNREEGLRIVDLYHSAQDWRTKLEDI